MPNELLSAIFKEAATNSGIRMRVAKSISQVSRCWRDIAVHLPILWSEIYIPWDARDGYVNFLTIVVHRSRAHPLDIKVDVEYSYVDFIDDHLDIRIDTEYPYGAFIAQHLHIVTPEVSRWRSFSYKGDSTNFVLEILACLVHLRAPILESFELLVSEKEDEEMDNRSVVLFKGGAPLLSHIHIRGVEVVACRLPPSSVTTLRLEEAMDGIEAWELMEVLEHMPRLVSLTLIGDIVDPVDLHTMAMKDEGIQSTSLRLFSFTACASPKSYIESMLSTIHCPDLESLTISATGCGPTSKIDIASEDDKALSIPTYPSLRTFTLIAMECPEFAHNFNFTDLPSIETISLMECISPMAFLRPLLSSEPENEVSNDNIWPLLRTLKLSNLGSEEFDGLRQAITHRQACRRPIEVVEIDAHSLDKFPEDVDWIGQQVVVRRGGSGAKI